MMMPMRLHHILFCFLCALVPPAQADVVNATFNTATDVAVTANGYTATGNTVAITLNHAPAVGAELMIVKNTGLNFIQGSFDNLEQGQPVQLSFGGTNYDFVAHYYGGSGNDLVLVWAANQVCAWGRDFFHVGELGRGEYDFSPKNLPREIAPTPELAGKTIVAVDAGLHHSLALCSDGTMFAWGFDEHGQLGNSSFAFGLSPDLPSESRVAVKVEMSPALDGKRVVAISVGGRHNLALCSDGTILAWGWNEHGQCGNNSTTDVPLPIVLNPVGTALAGKSVVSISAGAGHSLALCSDGTLVAWGDNGLNQLGDGTSNDSLTPVLVDASGVLAGKTVMQIKAGAIHNMVLCSDGTLAAWGNNEFGQLGDGTTTHRASPVSINASGALSGKTISAFSAGYGHCLALCNDGTLVSWGRNNNGELGIGNITSSLIPVPVDVTGVLNGKTISQIGVGGDIEERSFAFCTDGTLAAWGTNGSGQLGDNTFTDKLLPVLVNTNLISAGSKFTRISEGSSNPHNLAIISGPPAPEILATFGSGTSEPFMNDIGFANTIVGAKRGPFIPLKISSVGHLELSDIAFTFTGSNPGDFTVIGPVPDSLAPGESLIIPIKFTPTSPGTKSAVLRIASNDADEDPRAFSVGGIATSGVNAVYNTGDEIPLTVEEFTATGNPLTFTLNFVPPTGKELMVVKNTGLGFIQGEFNGVAHGQTVTLNYGGNSYPLIADYYGGDGNDLTLVGDMKVYAWGRNPDGRLGVGDTANYYTPVPVSTSGVLAGKTVLRVAGGSYHSLALCSDGTLAAWGKNDYGQLGDGSTTDRHLPVAVDMTGVLSGKRIAAIAAGETHSVALCSDGIIVCWGNNEYGQFGNGNTSSPIPVTVTTSALVDKTVVAVTTSYSGTAALCSDGSAIVWGIDGIVSPTTIGMSAAVESKNIVSLGHYGDRVYALCSDSSLLEMNWMDLVFEPAQIIHSTGVIQEKEIAILKTGPTHALALCTDGSLVSWGYDNNWGQQGNGTGYAYEQSASVNIAGQLVGKTFTQIATGPIHSMALCSDGTLATWGYQRAIGQGNSGDAWIPMPINDFLVPSGVHFARLYNGTCADEHSLALGVIAPIPEIAVFGSTSTNITSQFLSFDTSAFIGTIAVNSSKVVTFTIKNIGLSPLTGLSISKTGSDAFSFTAPALNTLAFNESTTFTVTFNPSVEGGPFYGGIYIASNDENENPFAFGVSGTALSELENWRLTYFGTISNFGNGANTATPMKDGVNNLLKFATGMNPTQSGKMPGVLTKDGNNLVFTYTRSKAAMSSVFYTVEWRDSLLSGSWSSAGVTESVIDLGATEEVTATVPAGSGGQRFVRLRVTAP